MEGQVMEHAPGMEQTCHAAVPRRSGHASGVRCRVLAHSGMIACWDAEQSVETVRVPDLHVGGM